MTQTIRKAKLRHAHSIIGSEISTRYTWRNLHKMGIGKQTKLLESINVTDD